MRRGQGWGRERAEDLVAISVPLLCGLCVLCGEFVSLLCALRGSVAPGRNSLRLLGPWRQVLAASSILPETEPSIASRPRRSEGARRAPFERDGAHTREELRHRRDPGRRD